MWRKGDPLAFLVRMEIGATTMANSMEGPQDIKRTTIYSLLGIFPKKRKRGSQIDFFTIIFTIHFSFMIIHNSQIWKQSKCQWINKEYSIISFSHK